MLDLIIIVILSILCVPLAGFSTGAFRIIFGIIFLLFSPGYSLIAALFPRNSSLSGLERIILSLILSISVVAVIGLGLNYTALGLYLWPFLISVLVFILCASTIAFFRRRKLSIEARFSFHPSVKRQLVNEWWGKKDRWGKSMYLVLAIMALATIGILMFVVANPKVKEGYTEFYILGTEGKMGDYPVELIIGEESAFPLQISNFELERTTYRIEVEIDDVIAGSVGPIILDDEEGWQGDVAILPDISGDNLKLEFLLYKEGRDEPYRNLHLWVDVVEKE